MLVVDVLLIGLHVLFSLMLVLFILLHRGAGGGLSDLFGGGGGGLHGNAMVEKNLDRLTVGAAIGFTLTNTLLALFVV